MKSLPPAQRDRLQRWLAEGVELPARPALLMEIEALKDEPSFHVRRLAALVKRDPALTARLFEMVNSPAFGLGRQLDTVEEALFILGLGPALNLFRAILLRQALGEDHRLDRFWQRSAFIAELSAAIVQRQQLPAGHDLAYLAGLFHAIGVVVLQGLEPGYSRVLANDAGWCELPTLEQRHQLDHALVGAHLCQQWHLPESVAEAVRCQADPASAQSHGVSLASALQLAIHLYDRLFAGVDAPGWEQTQAAVLARLGLEEDDLANLI